jgi:hypothetical protein
MSESGEIFFKMQVINEAFRLVIFGIWGWESELLGILERALIRQSFIFFQEN